MEKIIEGKTEVFVFKSDIPSRKMPVFYNPAKARDRDITVKVIGSLKPKKCLEMLSASGICGIRLIKEAGVDEVVFNDINKDAYKLIKKNLEHNKIKARVFNMDANKLLFHLGESFDYIDIDPFGTPNPYIQNAVRFLKRRGILSITAVDIASMMVFKEAGLRKYQAHIKRHPFMRETGLRILIKHAIEEAASLEYALEPIFAYASNYYFRVFFRKEIGAKRCDALVKEIKHIYYCPTCGHRGFKKCKHESFVLGPIYTGKINRLKIDDEFVKQLNKEDEFPPWHYTTTEFKKERKISEIIKKVNGIRCHYNSKGFKTKENLTYGPGGI